MTANYGIISQFSAFCLIRSKRHWNLFTIVSKFILFLRIQLQLEIMLISENYADTNFILALCLIFETENLFVFSYEGSGKKCVCLCLCVLVVLILNNLLAIRLLYYKKISRYAARILLDRCTANVHHSY